jgi:hypothetical protein
MTDIQTPFLEFREALARHIREMETQYVERHSIEWYLLHYMKRVSKRAMSTNSPAEVNGAVRGLVRFYVDSIDQDSSLGRRCAEVVGFHRRALRLYRRE